MDEYRERWDALDAAFVKRPELPVQVSGANLRGFLNAGESRPRNERLCDAPAVLAMNELTGFRILPNLWEHVRAAVTTRKESPFNTLAYLIEEAGATFAPFYDRRTQLGARTGPETCGHHSPIYTRACGREFKVRMATARRLTEEWQMRALWHPVTLNVLLSLYCGTLMSRNALIVCHEIGTAAWGPGADRARLFHRREVAIAFRYELGQWWWVDETKGAWCPTLSGTRSLPPLKYMDIGAVYVPAEVE